MAITFIEAKQRQKKLIWVLAILIFVILFIFAQGFFKKSIIKEIQMPVKTKKVTINFKILENPIFKNLQPYEEIKAFEGTLGRENPFFPY